MSDFATFVQWCGRISILDWAGLALFLLAVGGYRTFLATMLKSRPDRLYLGKLQAYRNAWIAAHSGDQNSLVTVQTLRNTIMAASFLASTAVLLIMGAVNLLGNMDGLHQAMGSILVPGTPSPAVDLLKILLLIITLSYSFFSFTSYIREVNYLSFILNIPKDQLDAIEDGDSTLLLSQIFLTSGIHFSMGMRGYYFLIPLFLWLFSPVFLIVSTLLILGGLLRRDLRR